MDRKKVVLFFCMLLLGAMDTFLSAARYGADATLPICLVTEISLTQMSSIQSNFSPEELREHRELFESFDTDGSGEIDAEELQQLCGTLGNKLSLAEAEEMIADIDVDGNGLVDFNEFLSMMLDIRGSK